MSNNFWYGVLMGAGLVFAVFIVTTLLARARAKSIALRRHP
jgi:prolipoprotein diacylglyceryltransferase